MLKPGRYYQAVYILAAKDLKQRTSGSYLGWLWLMIEPAAMLVIYTFVFGFLLKVRFDSGGGTDNFTLNLMAALIPFTAFREAVERSTSSLTSNRDLIQRVVFPPLLLPVVISVTSLFTELLGLILIVIAVALMGVEVSIWIFMFPLLMLTRLLLNLGIGWLLSILNVFFRDLGQMIGILMTVIFFSTPIIYPSAVVPPDWRWVFELNPFYYLVSAYRAIFIHGSPPESGFYVVMVLSIVVASLGLLFFGKTIDRAKDLL